MITFLQLNMFYKLSLPSCLFKFNTIEYYAQGFEMSKLCKLYVFFSFGFGNSSNRDIQTISFRLITTQHLFGPQNHSFSRFRSFFLFFSTRFIFIRIQNQYIFTLYQTEPQHGGPINAVHRIALHSFCFLFLGFVGFQLYSYVNAGSQDTRTNWWLVWLVV